MNGVDYDALNAATRGCRFRVVSIELERCVVWFGGSSLVVYDLRGGHIDTIGAGLFGGAAERRREALRMIGQPMDR